MVRRGTPSGYISFRKARLFASKKRKSEVKVWINDSLKKIGKSYESLVMLKRKPGLSLDDKKIINEKIGKLRDLQKMNLDLAKKHGIKL